MVFYLAAIARNIHDKFMNFQMFAGEFLHEFPDARVFVYENNSTDNTKDMLEMWTAMNNRVIVKCETISDSEMKAHCIARSMDNTPCRMEMIAYARNRLMEMLEETDIGTREEDRIIMFDADVNCVMSAQPLIDLLKRKDNDYDALFANGISQRKNYYDISAYYDMYFLLVLNLLKKRRSLEKNTNLSFNKFLPLLHASLLCLHLEELAFIVPLVFVGCATKEL